MCDSGHFCRERRQPEIAPVMQQAKAGRNLMVHRPMCPLCHAAHDASLYLRDCLSQIPRCVHVPKHNFSLRS